MLRYVIALVLAFCGPGVACAAVLLISSGKLTGANQVDVGGVSYDVRFVEGTCAQLFSGCDEPSDFTFPDLASASQASTALLDQVFIDGPQGQFDSMPDLTYGCTLPNFCGVFSPYLAVPSDSVLLREAINRTPGGGPDVLSSAQAPIDDNMSDLPGDTFAIWTLANQVPEAGSLALSLLGLGILSAVNGHGRRLRARPGR